mmetsp:Transcript_35454/g.81087  ORF Transcript_35454/g.81087 Transcript_35454/m.81087 type:complete len:720 (+) Transcript_35454:97-2256(+)
MPRFTWLWVTVITLITFGPSGTACFDQGLGQDALPRLLAVQVSADGELLSGSPRHSRTPTIIRGEHQAKGQLQADFEDIAEQSVGVMVDMTLPRLASLAELDLEHASDSADASLERSRGTVQGNASKRYIYQHEIDACDDTYNDLLLYLEKKVSKSDRDSDNIQRIKCALNDELCMRQHVGSQVQGLLPDVYTIAQQEGGKCDAGSKEVLNLTECMRAATVAMGKSWSNESKVVQPDHVLGCYQDPGNGSIYWNNRSRSATGTKGYPVCKNGVPSWRGLAFSIDEMAQTPGVLEELPSLGDAIIGMATAQILVWCTEGYYVSGEGGETAKFGNQLENSTESLLQSQGTPAKVVQGDMLIEDDWSSSLLEASIASGSRWGGKTWPHGLPPDYNTTAAVPYCLHSEISETARIAVRSAMVEIEQQVPCISFAQISTLDDNSGCALPESGGSIIVKSDESGCWSYVGVVEYRSGQRVSQPLNLGLGCDTSGIAQHELNHALGMLHEQSRSDRDNVVDILRTHIAPAMYEANFGELDAAYKGSPYDILSIMHYDPYAFSETGELTIKPHNALLVPYMGQRVGMSQLDVEHLGEMYQCLADVKPIHRNKAESLKLLRGEVENGFEGPCADHDGYTDFALNGDRQTCKGLWRHCADPTVRSTCPVTCYQCLPGNESEDAARTGTSTSKMAIDAAEAHDATLAKSTAPLCAPAIKTMLAYFFFYAT